MPDPKKRMPCMHGIPSFSGHSPSWFHSERGEREIGFDSKKRSLSPVLEMILLFCWFGDATNRKCTRTNVSSTKSVVGGATGCAANPCTGCRTRCRSKQICDRPDSIQAAPVGFTRTGYRNQIGFTVGRFGVRLCTFVGNTHTFIIKFKTSIKGPRVIGVTMTVRTFHIPLPFVSC